MRRRLFTVAAAVSAVLCVGLGAAIARSYRVLDQWNCFRGTEFWSVEVEQGQMYLVHAWGNADLGTYKTYRRRPADRSLPPIWSPFQAGSRRALAFGAGGRSGPVTLNHYRVSLGWVAALAAVTPAAVAIRRRPWRRWFGKLPPGCCPSCGYDLRATPGRCPECGAVPELAKGAA